MMNKEKKKIYIEEMKDVFSKTSSIYITHYQGPLMIVDDYQWSLMITNDRCSLSMIIDDH